jgi:4,5-DOPA dioxygenase extradiol
VRRFRSLFVSHGAPTLLFEPGATPVFLRKLGGYLGRPKGIVCASAHWEAARPTVGAAGHPGTIHDFQGFPRELYTITYPAPGDPGLARRVADLLRGAGLEASEDPERGLDHGAWVPLLLMYPQADVPVVPLSIQSRLDAAHHLALGRALRPLLDDGVLLLGSGGATHDLREFGRYPLDAPAPDFVRDFESWLCECVVEGKEADLLAWRERGPHAARNHPTPEHFLPLFVPLGAGGEGARGRVLHRAFSYGVLSLAAFAWE